MSAQQLDVGGRDYLELVTQLLHRVRAADPDAGLWEAADLQWWWRRDQHSEPSNARFWLDDRGAPIAAVVFTDWGDRWGADVIEVPGADTDPAALWQHVANRSDQLRPVDIETALASTDSASLSLAAAAGFLSTEDAHIACRMDTSRRPLIAPLPPGYVLTSRAAQLDRPHHMISRSGPDVAQRLAQCSLYRPDLDLVIHAPDGTVAAYGLFWADTITGVGLVEPMRTEDDHQHMGLGRHVLTAGLELLAAAGCTRLKIAYFEANDVARRLYLSSGFVGVSRDITLVRSGA